MNNAVKCMKLDYLLLKPYLKSMIILFLAPLLFPIFTGSLFQGLSFAVMVVSMTTAYTFSVAEKNDLARFYGFLPAKRKSLVTGRYLTVFSLGFSFLLLSAAAQVTILYVRSQMPQPAEIWGSLILDAFLFCVYVVVQIPGYYRFGTIKGKIFMFIPTVGCLLLFSLVELFSDNIAQSIAGFLQNPAMLIAGGLILTALIILVSMKASNKIVEKNRD